MHWFMNACIVVYSSLVGRRCGDLQMNLSNENIGMNLFKDVMQLGKNWCDVMIPLRPL